MSERRVLQSEIRTTGMSGRTISGYAAKYGIPTTIASAKGQRFVEVLAPGAFRDSIGRGDDCVCLLNHNSDRPLGRASTGTLRVSEDFIGLAFECDLPDSADDVLEAIQRGDIRAMSFQFSNAEDDWDTDEDPDDRSKRMPRRTIRTLRLHDVSPVVFPAYPHTVVNARAEDVSGIVIPELTVRKTTPMTSIEIMARRRRLLNSIF